MKTVRAVSVLICMFLATTLMWAQGTTSRITGQVTDPTGAVIAGATVQAVNLGTNQTFTTKTTAAGVYVFDSLQIGTYTISAEASGFKRTVSTGNILSIGVPSAVNLVMQIGTNSESVEVKGGYELVQTETSGNFGSVIDNETLTSLPIVGVRGRNPLNFVYLVPGINDGGGNQTGGGVSMHGSRDRAWNYTLDGIDINESTSGGSNTIPTKANPDSLAEFRVITSNFTPEYGRNTGADVTMVTKSGTNDFHGTAFWYYQSPFLQANTPQNKQYESTHKLPNQRSQFVQNIPGFSVGGPIRKNKDFFFVNVEFLHALNTFLVTNSVYTDMAKKGIFRYVNGGRNFPSGSATPSVDANGNPMPGVNISTYDMVANDPAKIGLDPGTAKMLAMEPSPNNFTIGDGLNIAGYTFVAPQLEKQVDLTFKVDHVFSPTNLLFVRWYSGHQNTYGDQVNGGLKAFPGLPNQVDTHRKPRNLAVNWRTSPTARTTNELVLGFNYFGYQFVNPDPNAASTPPFNFNNVPEPLNSWFANNRYAMTYQLVDNFTFASGAHTWKWGFNGRYLREIDQRGSIGSVDAYPQVFFDTSTNPVSVTQFNLPAACSKTVTTNCMYSGDQTKLESSINDMLGRVGQIQAGYVANRDLQTFKPTRTVNNMDHRWPEYDVYFQDTYKLKSNLTVDYGIRWEIRIAPHLASFPDLVPNQNFLLGQNANDSFQFVPGKLYNSSWKNFGPSVGIAWDPFKDGKSSVRAHYRIAYDRINPFSFSSSVFQGMPGLTYQDIDTTSGQAGMRASNWKAPVPTVTPQSLTLLPAYSVNSLTVADPNLRTPKVYMWGLSLEHQIANNTVLSLTYNGNHGVGLYGGYDSNQANYANNGFLQAFQAAQAGQDSPLLTQIVSGDPRHTAGQSGTAFVQANYASFLATNNVAGLANTLANRLVSGVPLVVASGMSPYFFKPYPQVLGGLFVLDTRDFSNYNDLEVQVERRFSNGLAWQASWTWAKSLDVRSFDPTFSRILTGTSQGAAGTPFDYNNLRLNYGPSDFDRTHMLQSYWVWDLPFGKGKRFGGATSKLLDELIGGYEVAGNVLWETGRPMNIASGANTFSGSVATPVSCDKCSPYMGSLFTQGTNQYYMNATAFNSTTNSRTVTYGNTSANMYIPAAGQFSNIGRNFFRQPINWGLNMTVAKTFSITERQNLQVRLEMQNVTNSVTYDLPSQNLQSGTFERANAATDAVINNAARRMQLALKYTF